MSFSLPKFFGRDKPKPKPKPKKRGRRRPAKSPDYAALVSKMAKKETKT